MPMQKITRGSLSEQVADSLRDHIYTTLGPDDLLPSTATLGAEYNVSRIVIREALKYLEAQDIIEVTKATASRKLGDGMTTYAKQRAAATDLDKDSDDVALKALLSKKKDDWHAKGQQHNKVCTCFRQASEEGQTLEVVPCRREP